MNATKSAGREVIRCGYCGKFTPINKKDWWETICEHCNHYIDGCNAPTEEDKSCEPN